MQEVILWGTGKTFNHYINLIKYHEIINNIKVVGVVSNTTVFADVAGYRYIDKKEIAKYKFDIVIYFGDEKKIKEMKEEAKSVGICEEKIVLYKMLTVQNLNVEKYMELVKNPPTIFANNCWGGVVYNRLGLEFSSPLVNMYESDEDYIKFLKNPKKYLDAPLLLEQEIYSEYVNGSFPVCSCDDILLYFNHYNSFEAANAYWEKRKKRINWNNLLVMLSTENEKSALEFSTLPYEKKICFVPFETKIKSLFHVDFRNKNEAAELPFWKIIMSTVNSDYCCYDLLELIDSGNIVRVSQ